NVDGRRRVELAGVDRLLHAAEIHLVHALAEDVGEAALGQAAMDGHLPALEALDGDARARGLALAAAPAGLALAGADAAADALARLARAGPILELAELHCLSPCGPSTSTRCCTLAIMPRVDGVSGTSATRPMRLRPRPIRFWR